MSKLIVSVIRANAIATHLVILAKRASNDRPLFFDMNVSEDPPVIAPESPALFPDWSSMTAIKNKAESMCTILNAITIRSHSFQIFRDK